MGFFFFIRTMVILFLTTASLTIQFQFSNGDKIEEKGRRLGGRTGIKPPAPATNPVKHNLPLTESPGCYYSTPVSPPPGRTNKGKHKRHMP